MTEEQEQELLQYAKAWLTRTHLGRNEEEKNAYIEGVQDALQTIFQYTYHGAYPAHRAYDALDVLFNPE